MDYSQQERDGIAVLSREKVNAGLLVQPRVVGSGAWRDMQRG